MRRRDVVFRLFRHQRLPLFLGFRRGVVNDGIVVLSCVIQ